MTGKRLLFCLSATAILATQTACSMFLEDTYSSVTPHTVAPVSEENNFISVESYHELVNALTYFVTEMEETGQIRLSDYDKDNAKTDLNTAIIEVMNETAWGSYAVSSIHWDTNTIMGYLEAQIQITYKKTPEEVDEILLVSGTTALVRAISQGLNEMEDSVILQNSRASTDRSQVPSMMQRAYQLSAQSLVELPEVHTTFYPKEGAWRMIELSFHYTLSPETRQERLIALEDSIAQLTSPLWSMEEEDYFQALVQVMTEVSTPSNVGDTPYHVLVEGSGTSRGVALAYLALCQEMNLSCEVIEGTLYGETYHWNRITKEDGSSFHLDVSLAPLEEGKTPYYTPQEMKGKGYDWQD